MRGERGGAFYQEMIAEEQAAMAALAALDKMVEGFCGEGIRVHTMAANGTISGLVLEEKIALVKAKGTDIARQLDALSGRITHLAQITEDHLVGHLPEEEEVDGKS